MWPILHRWPCQKQPLTKTTDRLAGSTISGEPGSSFRCNRNRRPAMWSAVLTQISGLVFFGPIRRIRSDLSLVVRVSATIVNQPFDKFAIRIVPATRIMSSTARHLVVPASMPVQPAQMVMFKKSPFPDQIWYIRHTMSCGKQP